MPQSEISDHIANPQSLSKDRQRRLRWVLIGLGSFAALALVAGIFIYFYIFANLPKLTKLTDYAPSLVTEFYARDFRKFAEYSQERRFLVDYEDIPKGVIQAFIASEDSNFFKHEGIDYSGIGRAFVKNIWAGRIVQGGSTITQQVAKSLLLTSERSFRRKIKELILAHRIEKNLTKEEILFLYLNQIYLGHGAYGVQAAALSYFQKDVQDLNLAEAAFLAGLPQAPSRYSPFRSVHRTQERQQYVLQQMQENNFITEFDRLAAINTDLKIFRAKETYMNVGRDFAEYLRRIMQEKYGSDTFYRGGLKIFTTLDLNKQEMAERAVRQGLEELDRRQGYRGILAHLDLKDEKAMDEFLKKSHEQANEKPFIIIPGTQGTLESQESPPAEAETPTLLEGEKHYEALITEFEPTGRYAIVRIGTQTGRIQLDDMKWVREPDPEIRFDENIHYLKDPRKKFKAGDVVLVSLKTLTPEELKSKKYEKDILYFKLIQKPLVQGSLLSMEPASGYVIAMVGGYNFKESEFNRAVQSLRQPGSAFKPVIYSAALDKGYTPSSIIVDSPLVFQSQTEEEEAAKWKPKNYGNKFHGDTPFRQALVKSMNVITIKILQDIGIPYVTAYAKNLGLTSALNQDLSLALGSSEVSLLELTKIYAVFALGGKPSKSVFLTKVLDREGRGLERTTDADGDLSQAEVVAFLKNKMVAPAMALDEVTEGTEFQDETAEITPTPQENPPGSHLLTEAEREIIYKKPPHGYVMTPQTAYLITHLMTDVVQYGTGQKVRELGRPVAGKTGTTNDAFDAWFVGFTPDVLTGVWVGYDQKQPLGRGETGGHSATPIWLYYMKEATKDTPIRTFEVPDNIVFTQVNKETGYLADAQTPANLRMLGAYLDGTQPTSSKGPQTTIPEDEFFLIDSQWDEQP